MKKTFIALACVALLSACTNNHKNDMPVPKGDSPSEETSSPGLVIETIASQVVVPVSEPVGASEVTTVTTAVIKNWAGKYAGELPCADCDALKTELKLNPNQTYELKETYLGKSEKPFITQGKITFDAKKPNIVTLHQTSGSQQYLLENNQVIALDQEGNRIEGAMANLYILKKTKMM